MPIFEVLNIVLLFNILLNILQKKLAISIKSELMSQIINITESAKRYIGFTSEDWELGNKKAACGTIFNES